MKLILIIFTLTLTIHLGFGQAHKNDISIGYSILENYNSPNHFQFQIGRLIRSKLRINIGYSTYRQHNLLQGINRRISISDSTYIVRNQRAIQARNLNFRLGASYVFSDYFSLGSHFIIGQMKSYSEITDTGYPTNEEKTNWIENSMIVNTYHESDPNDYWQYQITNTIYEAKHLVIGIGLNAELLYPILKKRVQIGFRYSPEIIYLNETQNTITYDRDNLFKERIGSYWDANSITSIVAKFRF